MIREPTFEPSVLSVEQGTAIAVIIRVSFIAVSRAGGPWIDPSLIAPVPNPDTAATPAS